MSESATKTDNAFLEAKLTLRRYFLVTYHATRRPRVMDCCMGDGVIWKKLRDEFEVESYWGLDVKARKGRLAVDSVRVLEQKGWAQDVVDVDTYGSPWKHWCAMLPNVTQPTTVFLTLGLVRMGGGGGVDSRLLAAAGIKFRRQVPPSLTAKIADQLVPFALSLTSRYGLRIVEAQEATRSQNARYLGVRVEPDPP